MLLWMGRRVGESRVKRGGEKGGDGRNGVRERDGSETEKEKSILSYAFLKL